MQPAGEMEKSWNRLCQDPRTTSELLKKAAYWESINRSSEFAIRRLAARHRAANEDLLATLALVDDLYVKIHVAAHTNLSEATAGKLLKSRIRSLRKSLASNPKIPVFVMNRLARDHEDVRVELARNPKLPRRLMIKMAKESSVAVRLSLARNNRVLPRILEFFSRDKSELVRCAVVSHPGTPLVGLLGMAEDDSPAVRKHVLQRAIEDFPQERVIFERLSRFSNCLSAGIAAHHLKSLVDEDFLEESQEIN